jgi:neutral ceramidase
VNKCWLWLCCALLGCSLGHALQAAELRAGVARVSITPAADEFPYANGGDRPFVDVHDDVYARALILDDGERRVAVVLVEVTKIPAPTELKTAIAKELRTPEAQVMLAATHTHIVPLFSYHTPTPNPAETKEIERLNTGTLQAVRQAQSHMQPARIAFGRGEGWINVNNGEQSGTKSYDAHGPSDKTLDVIRVESSSGDPIALLVNYATHAEVMFRSITKDNAFEVSGDLPGAVSAILESQPGAAPVVLYSAAAEADQLTLFKSLQPAGRLPAADEGAGGWALLHVQARRLAASVMDVLAAMPPGAAQVRIDAAAGVATCPGQKMHMDRQSGQVTTESTPPVDIPLNVIKINDIVLAGVGGDVATEIGMAIKGASPMAHTTLITVTAGEVGYILGDASYEHPGHGVMGSPLQPHCAQQAITDGLVRLIDSKAAARR